MNEEKLIETIRAQNDLIILLCQETQLTKAKTEETRQRIVYLMNKLRDFNKDIPQ